MSVSSSFIEIQQFYRASVWHPSTVLVIHLSTLKGFGEHPSINPLRRDRHQPFNFHKEFVSILPSILFSIGGHPVSVIENKLAASIFFGGDHPSINFARIGKHASTELLSGNRHQSINLSNSLASHHHVVEHRWASLH